MPLHRSSSRRRSMPTAWRSWWTGSERRHGHPRPRARRRSLSEVDDGRCAQADCERGRAPRPGVERGGSETRPRARGEVEMTTASREKFLEQRKLGIGGSDVAHLFNEPPYGCSRRLWLEKRGIPPDYPESPTDIMERGN